MKRASWEKTTKFTIECEMQSRWVPYFLAVLKRMEWLGKVGSSRRVALYSDGDGDFQPEFKWAVPLPDHEEIKPVEDVDGHQLYDAG